MNKILSTIYPLAVYREPLVRMRAVGLYTVATLLAVGTLAVAAMFLIAGVRFDPLTTSQGLALVVAGGVAVLLTRRGFQAIGAVVFNIVWFSVIIIGALFGILDTQAAFLALLLGQTFGALLVGGWTVPYTALVMIVFLLVAPFFRQAGTDAPPVVLFEIAILILSSVTHYAVAYGLVRAVKNIQAQAESRSIRIAGAGGAAAQRLLVARLDMPSLLQETIRLVQEGFASADVVQVFLVDKERRYATLMACSDDDKSRLGQQIGVGSLNVIGRVTISGQSVMVRDTAEEQTYRRQAFLAGTQAELVLPLQARGETLGVLDVQSRSAEAFPPEAIEALNKLADQIAVAIDTCQQFVATQAALADVQGRYNQTMQNLHENERLTQQLTGAAWVEYLRGIGVAPAYTIEPGIGRVEDAADWTSAMSEAGRRNQVIVRTGGQTKLVALPISVRGQVIGAMEFEVGQDQIVGPEQMSVLQQVVERLGLAAENIRLLDEAQRMAQREAMVNEITARMQTALNVEAVIAAATQSLADAFEAPRVAIRLGNPQPGAAGGSNGAYRQEAG